ncbi:hypothetical protein IQ22_00335 [Pseudomonas duriflava]|uniref:Uncharacterized protein n=2 Tax=Pseudomonas duriflava TaxID=459528 RepID=A0A562QPH7_9PSED|nr:hypothetical protein IQ22_00335 [Pseudomonas duriflava]
MGMYDRDWHRERYRQNSNPKREPIAPRPPTRRKSFSIVSVFWLAVAVTIMVVIWDSLDGFVQLKPDQPSSFPPPVTQTPSSSALPSQLRPITVQEPVVTHVPKPLRECMQGSNTIDESVLHCRFGEVPRTQAQAAKPAQGMVSAAYLAQYKADMASGAEHHTATPREHEQHWIEKWSGGERYLAVWDVVDNRIDGTSVCSNHRRGSIDYRECRKGAKQYFKQQCQAWQNRYERDGQSYSRRQEQRYCSAGNSFNPIG